MDIGCLRRRADLLGRGFGAGVGDVFGDGPVEEEGVLHNGGDVLPQGLDGDVPDVLPVDADGAGLRLVEAGDELGDGGLADAGRADEGDHLTGLRAEGNVLQHRHALHVGEADVIEGDLALHVGQRLCTGPVLDLAGSVKDRHHALRAGHGLLHALQEVREARDGRVKEAQVQ